MNHHDFLEAAAYIELYIRQHIDVCLVLNPDFSSLVDQVEEKVKIPYDIIPHFPKSKNCEHAYFIVGTIHGKGVLIMHQTFQRYFHDSLEDITFPIYIIHLLGIKRLVFVDYCEALNPSYQLEDFIITENHINGTGVLPRYDMLSDHFGDARIAMDEPYDATLSSLAKRVADKLMIQNHYGVRYVYPGPMYPTNAEANMYRILGADISSMHHLYEVVTARYLGMQVLSLSCVVRKPGSHMNHDDITSVQERVIGRYCAWIQNIVLEM